MESRLAPKLHRNQEWNGFWGPYRVLRRPFPMLHSSSFCRRGLVSRAFETARTGPSMEARASFPGRAVGRDSTTHCDGYLAARSRRTRSLPHHPSIPRQDCQRMRARLVRNRSLTVQMRKSNLAARTDRSRGRDQGRCWRTSSYSAPATARWTLPSSPSHHGEPRAHPAALRSGQQELAPPHRPILAPASGCSQPGSIIARATWAPAPALLREVL